MPARLPRSDSSPSAARISAASPAWLAAGCEPAAACGPDPKRATGSAGTLDLAAEGWPHPGDSSPSESDTHSASSSARPSACDIRTTLLLADRLPPAVAAAEPECTGPRGSAALVCPATPAAPTHAAAAGFPRASAGSGPAAASPATPVSVNRSCEALAPGACGGAAAAAPPLGIRAAQASHDPDPNLDPGPDPDPGPGPDPASHSTAPPQPRAPPASHTASSAMPRASPGLPPAEPPPSCTAVTRSRLRSSSCHLRSSEDEHTHSATCAVSRRCTALGFQCRTSMGDKPKSTLGSTGTYYEGLPPGSLSSCTMV